MKYTTGINLRDILDLPKTLKKPTPITKEKRRNYLGHVGIYDCWKKSKNLYEKEGFYIKDTNTSDSNVIYFNWYIYDYKAEEVMGENFYEAYNILKKEYLIEKSQVFRDEWPRVGINSKEDGISYLVTPLVTREQKEEIDFIIKKIMSRSYRNLKKILNLLNNEINRRIEE